MKAYYSILLKLWIMNSLCVIKKIDEAQKALQKPGTDIKPANIA